MKRHNKLRSAMEELEEAFKAYLEDCDENENVNWTQGVRAAFMIDLESELVHMLHEYCKPKDVEMLMAVLSHEARGAVTNEIYNQAVPKRIRYPSN
jgi:hypothetical protein